MEAIHTAQTKHMPQKQYTYVLDFMRILRYKITAAADIASFPAGMKFLPLYSPFQPMLVYLLANVKLVQFKAAQLGKLLIHSIWTL